MHALITLATLVSLIFISAVKDPVPVTAPVDPDPAYTQVIQDRAQKIVDTLGIAEPAKALLVRDLIADQYRSLNTLHDTRDHFVQTNKNAYAVETVKKLTQSLQDQLHTRYLLKLAATLNPKQIDQVKDGMTYGVVPLTYRSYLDMLPDLTAEQKSQIMAYLVEAREQAMDGGSSKEKHGWFGKYKGRINNYLSAEGYDLATASKARNVRINAAKP